MQRTVLVIGVVLFSLALSQGPAPGVVSAARSQARGELATRSDLTWNPARSSAGLRANTAGVGFFNCSEVRVLCLVVAGIDVTHTPNDSGRFEEWVVRTKLEGRDSTGRNFTRKHRNDFKVPDRMSGGNHRLNLNIGSMCFGDEALYSSTGREDDRGRFRDDPIPELRVNLRNVCLQPNPPDTISNGVFEQRICRWDRSNKRHACWDLQAFYSR